ncbi:hypothetical protein CRUP_021681 [Coryphaenoides rupestris]|nr:hypothetical protein CRUP_021681 [Coryphaenoides rupestris]
MKGQQGQERRRRVIHFASGETLEEEDEDEEEDPTRGEPFREPPERTRRSWRKTGVLVMKMSLHACDFLGARLTGLLGLDAAKYQYAIDEHHRNARQPSEDPSEAEGELAVQSTRLDRSYGATKTSDTRTRTRQDSGQGSHNQAYLQDGADR